MFTFKILWYLEQLCWNGTVTLTDQDKNNYWNQMTRQAHSEPGLIKVNLTTVTQKPINPILKWEMNP